MAPLLQEQSHTTHYGVASCCYTRGASKQAPANLRISSRFKGITLTLLFKPCLLASVKVRHGSALCAASC